MTKQNGLKQGSTIGICAPSARFDEEKLNQGIKILHQLGYQTLIPEEIFHEKRYLAGDDMVRASVIHQLFSNPDIDAVMCARGGFGSLRILEYLRWDLLATQSKVFVGFSDITAMLLPMTRQLQEQDPVKNQTVDRKNVISNLKQFQSSVIHGPTVASLATAHEETIQSFQKIMAGNRNDIEITQGEVLTSGRCQGILKGGNISTISHLMGTRFQPDFSDCVVFLEDTGEPAYKIDRMLSHMKMAGAFNKITGVVTGSFTDCRDEAYIPEILLDTFSVYEVPVVTGLNAGHGRINLSLPMGEMVELQTKSQIIKWM